MLIRAHGLRLPDTFEVAGPDDSEQLRDWIGARRSTGPESWMVRVDAPPPVRFGINGATAAAADIPEVVRRIRRANADDRVRLLIQRRVEHRTDGIALRTARGRVVIESQGPSGGNFYRDGSTPSRWSIDAAEPEREVGCLSANGLVRLLAALNALPVATCLEWVLTPEDELYFVDAKALPREYLAAFDEHGSRSGYAVVLSGVARGTVVEPGGAGAGARAGAIHLEEGTGVDVLGRIEPATRAVVFQRGGLLAHAAVYAGQLGIPVLLCPPGQLGGLLPGAEGELVLDGGRHEFTPRAERDAV
ncbi:hypothetical protein [Glycomyces buryatensis]|uniref:PEP-utilising enzyme mobile domain-containing protein n=1 Tax=Glycomyces buryatensis TaxID=2570927 RepID=A0A4V4HRP8_9ACTN|nr:hypothetical protein [Glycomyces buryatensis]THV37616.1 hypothetical protein FAB82_20275 [Glycomyces buryatensis]